jgi:pimeloyl-ACP methyl ester carboxylesterase
MIDKGHGPLVVLIPGIQGRYEWMAPTIDALAVSHRVMSFSLGEAEPANEDWFGLWMRRIDELIDQARERSAIVIGVSFGGVVATRYAARRPERVRALVLCSVPPPGWKLNRRQERDVRYPRLALPGFVIRAFFRLAPEIMTARPSWPLRLKLGLEYGRRAVTARVAPSSMARWIRAWLATDTLPDCARIQAPTLVITGEPHLERVVPVAATREYLNLIPGARYAVLPETGHVGTITKPYRFTEIVGRFLATAEQEAAARAAAGHAAAVARWATGTSGRPTHAP